METIKEITKKLFSVKYETDLEDDEVYDKYVDMASQLIEKNDWLDVYSCWYYYLINNCKTEEDILNFAHLFWYYEGYNQVIPNPIEFCSYFYANISLENQLENSPVLDGIAWYALKNSDKYSNVEPYFENFEPLRTPEIISGIKKWKDKQNGLC